MQIENLPERWQSLSGDEQRIMIETVEFCAKYNMTIEELLDQCLALRRERLREVAYHAAY